jgi:DedD protein
VAWFILTGALEGYSMDRALLERMVGAVVLVLMFVVFVPALLDGRQEENGKQSVDNAGRAATRTEVIILNAAETPPPSVVESPAPSADKPSEKIKVTAKAKPKVTAKAKPKVTAKAKSAVAPAPKPTVVAEVKRQAPREGFAVQLGSFSSRDNAMSFAARVSEADYPIFVMKAATNGGAVYRVCAGPRPTREGADKLAAKLAADGQSVMVFNLGGSGGG